MKRRWRSRGPTGICARGVPRDFCHEGSARCRKAAPSATATKRRGTPDPRKRKQEEERLTREVEAKEAELKQIEPPWRTRASTPDGARTKDLLGRYEAARKEVDALWAKLAEVSETSGT